MERRDPLRGRLFVRSLMGILVVGGAALMVILVVAGARSLAAQVPKPLEKPMEGQTYVGSKNCSACHFDQFLDWRQTKHAKAYEILSEKYRADESCLKCHVTGYGEKSGFTSADDTPGLVGASCEACHGPGSHHAEVAKSFGDKKLSKEEDAYVRSTIYRMQPKNVCVDCHVTRAHKKHPEYEKE